MNKKAYIKPTTETVRMELAQVVATSIGLKTTTKNDVTGLGKQRVNDDDDDDDDDSWNSIW